MVLRMIIGLGLTVIAFAAGGSAAVVAEAAGVFRPAGAGAACVRARAPGNRPGGAADRGDRAAQAAEVDGARDGARGDLLGLHRAAADDHRGLRVAVPADLRDPRDRAVGGDRVHRGPVRDRGAGAVIATFTVIRVRNNPHKEGRRSRFFGSHTRAAWVVLGMISRGHHHAAALPGRAGEHRRVPLRERRGLAVRVLGRRQVRCTRSATGSTACSRSCSSWPARGDHGVPGRGVLLQAPAHLPGRAQRAVLAPPERAGAAGADAVGREGAGLRGGRPRHRRLRDREDRGPDLEGHARPGHLHRVRPLPVAVPRLGHRQAAVTQAAHPRPARPRVRQGPLPAGRRGRAGRPVRRRCWPRRSGRWSAAWPRTG